MSHKQKSIAILNVSAPFGLANAKDSLDIALIFGSYEQKVSLFYQADGVWQLIDNQQPEKIQSKNFLKTFSAFEFYDIEHIYVCQQSLQQRGLNNQFHIENVSILSENDFAKKMVEHQVILRF